MKKLLKTKQLSSIFISAGVIVAAIAAVFGSKRLIDSGVVQFAKKPSEFNRKSWKRIALRTKKSIDVKNLSMVAAGIAYGGTLAFFPLVVACVALASLVITPQQLGDVTTAITNFLPSDIASLLTTQLENAIDSESTNMIVAAAAIGIALFGVSSAIANLIKGLNVAYASPETRGFVRVRLVSLGLTCGMIIGLLVILPLILLGGDLLRTFGVQEPLVWLFGIARWILLALVMMFALALTYRYAPSRRTAKWQWVSWGAVAATILWLVITAVFFIYAQNFANFSDSYSLFAGIIVLMMWLNLTGLIILIGGTLNHELENETVLRTQKK